MIESTEMGLNEIRVDMEGYMGWGLELWSMKITGNYGHNNRSLASKIVMGKITRLLSDPMQFGMCEDIPVWESLYGICISGLLLILTVINYYWLFRRNRFSTN